jgi:methylated-DNA-[protein]-cysteine S-methyltransferase
VTKLHFHRFHTAFGEFAVVWDRSEKIKRIYMPGKSVALKRDFPSAEPAVSPNISSLSEDFIRFLDGHDVRFSLGMVALEECSFFQRNVLLAEYGIPRGCVSTYRRIAEHVGSPGGSRAVGGALSCNPFPIIVPCHRAVRSDGGLGGYQGGLDMKRRLLQMEGVEFTRSKVDMKRVYY